MIILILFVSSVCVSTHCAYVQNEGNSVSTSSTNNHLELSFVALNNVDNDDDRLISELQALEQLYGRSLIVDMIQNALEGFRDIIINGNDDIPVLDPLVIPVLGPYETTVINGLLSSITISNFRLEGLQWYLVDFVTINPLSLTLAAQVTIPRLTFTGNYAVVASFSPLLTYRAGGDFRLFINRIEFGAEARMGTNLWGGHLVLRRLDFKIDVHDTHIRIDGLTGSPILNAIISSLVQNVTQDLVQSQMDNVSQILSEQLFDVINDVLKDFTINDIFG